MSYWATPPLACSVQTSRRVRSTATAQTWPSIPGDPGTNSSIAFPAKDSTAPEAGCLLHPTVNRSGRLTTGHIGLSAWAVSSSSRGPFVGGTSKTPESASACCSRPRHPAIPSPQSQIQSYPLRTPPAPSSIHQQSYRGDSGISPPLQRIQQSVCGCVGAPASTLIPAHAHAGTNPPPPWGALDLDAAGTPTLHLSRAAAQISVG